MPFYEKYRIAIILVVYLLNMFAFVYFLVRSKAREEYALYWKGFLVLSVVGSIVVSRFIARIPDSLLTISKVLVALGVITGVYLIILGDIRRKHRNKTRRNEGSHQDQP